MQLFKGNVCIYKFLKHLREEYLSIQYPHLVKNHQVFNVAMCVTMNRKRIQVSCQFSQNFITNCLKWLVKLSKIANKMFLFLLGNNTNHRITDPQNTFERKGPLEFA